jgi:hypothetical protein
MWTEEGRALPELSPKDLPVAPIIVGHPKAAVVRVPRWAAEIRWIAE